ncbi:hypothetical protein M9Y10_010779 [Tritrichomonas musculus]|uniref:Uncharacterized protein n=1 Tax=Tritrichomonas musculus TaxID=1915356 RepID=A0ABR2IMJ3_9EUKA
MSNQPTSEPLIDVHETESTVLDNVDDDHCCDSPPPNCCIEQVQDYIDKINEQMPKSFDVPDLPFAELIRRREFLNWKIKIWNKELIRIVAKKTHLRGIDRRLAATLPKQMRLWKTERTKITHMLSLQIQKNKESENSNNNNDNQ